MNGSTLGVAGMALVGLAIGGAKLADGLPEPSTPLVIESPVVVDAPAVETPPAPVVVAAAPAAAMQAAPMDPRDPNSPQGLARTALDPLVPEGETYIDVNGDLAWRNPVIGYAPRPYGIPGKDPVCRYIQSPYVFGPGLATVRDDVSIMRRFDLLKNHDLGFDARILSPTP